MAPMVLMTTGFGLASPLTLSIAMIWLAHIGIDRALGYGLKYSAGFTFTHLGRIGQGCEQGNLGQTSESVIASRRVGAKRRPMILREAIHARRAEDWAFRHVRSSQ